MKAVDTYQATISLGFREGYSEKVHDIEEVKSYCQEYCDLNGFCVTVTPTTFIYKEGNEDGCFIGLINYPRFPSSPENILTTALKIANDLMIEFRQNKVSVICSDKTYMIESKRRIYK
jgi:hypothetical protein